MAVAEADLEREQDIGQLRRIALARHARIQQLIRQLQRKCDTLSFYTGNKDELQQTLTLIESLTKQANKVAEAAKKPAPRAPKKKPERSGPTEQPELPRVPQRFELDVADRTCPSCGGGLFEMKGQVETSEMIDVVEVSYRVVEVEQQKYVCRCGSCVETAPRSRARARRQPLLARPRDQRKAAAYAIGIWPKLIRFVDDARIPLDNNGTERAIRGPVVGRKVTNQRRRDDGDRGPGDDLGRCERSGVSRTRARA